MFQLPLMANNAKPIFFPCYSHTPFPTSFISDYHSHSFSHPSLLFSFIVATPTLVDRVTLFFLSLSFNLRAVMLGGLELKLAISSPL
jgi:hypothetical protein